MEEILRPITRTNKLGSVKEICINIQQIQENLKQLFPTEKIKDFATSAGVSHQTWLRWGKENRADLEPVLRLVKVYQNKLEDIANSNTPLSEASPEQLYLRCEQIGWGKVIGSMRKVNEQEVANEK